MEVNEHFNRVQSCKKRRTNSELTLRAKEGHFELEVDEKSTKDDLYDKVTIQDRYLYAKFDSIRLLRVWRDLLEKFVQKDSFSKLKQRVEIDGGKFRDQNIEGKLGSWAMFQVREDGVLLTTSVSGDIGEVFIPADNKMNSSGEGDGQNFHALIKLLNDYIDSIEGEKVGSYPFKKEFFDGEIVERVKSDFKSEDFQDALKNACLVLESRIREEGNFETSDTGKPMAEKAFSANNGSLSFGETDEEKRGVMNLYKGVFQAVRNPSNHRFLDDFGRKETYNLICYIDQLLKWIDTKSKS